MGSATSPLNYFNIMISTLLLNGLLLFSFPEKISLLTIDYQVSTKQEENKTFVVKDLDANLKPANYFDLENEKSVAAESPDWDIAFSRTSIKFNSSSNVKAQIIDVPFDRVEEAPIGEYIADSENEKALPGGSGNSWYVYDMKYHSISPIPGKTILIQLGNSKYAKLEILNYYKGAPEEIPTEESAFFTFRYSISNEKGQF